MVKGDYFPVVFAGASVARIGQFDNLRDFSSTYWGNDSKIFLGLNWNIFTGLSRNHKFRQAKNNMLMFQLSEQQTLENLDLQTRRAYEQVIISREYLGVAESVISLAEKSYSIARKAYEIGSKNFFLGIIRVCPELLRTSIRRKPKMNMPPLFKFTLL